MMRRNFDPPWPLVVDEVVSWIWCGRVRLVVLVPGLESDK
jgi:hypothetical protein